MRHSSFWISLGVLCTYLSPWAAFSQETISDMQQDQSNPPELQAEDLGIESDTPKTQYYKLFKEHFYKEDEFIEPISNPKDESYFFIVKKNAKNKPLSVGYYTQQESDSGDARFKLSQYVSKEGLAYYYLTYHYDNNLQLVKKEFKNKNDKVLYYYQYRWANNQLKSLEKHGKTPYLGLMELKGVHSYQWNDSSNLKSFAYYDKSKAIVEKYYFFSNPDSGEDKDPRFLVGNNKISMIVLDKYERYRFNTDHKKIRDYYIQYQLNENKIFQEKYNHDNVLIEELMPLEIPPQDPQEVAPPEILEN